MSDEAQAKMVLALGDAVDSLIGLSALQQKSVEGVLSKGSEAFKAVSQAGIEHQALARDLPRQVKAAIAEALEGAATNAAGILASQFSIADEQARLAADRYENAARALRWKLITASAVAWAATIAFVVLVVSYMNEEVRVLREDSNMLKNTVAYLKLKSQGAQLALCSSREKSQALCVYAQTANNKWEWQILAKRAETGASP